MMKVSCKLKAEKFLKSKFSGYRSISRAASVLNLSKAQSASTRDIWLTFWTNSEVVDLFSGGRCFSLAVSRAGVCWRFA